MTDEEVEVRIRSAIGGDGRAITWVVGNADSREDPVLLVMAALLERLPDRLDRASALASTSRDRQVVAIARAHLQGQHELVDAFVRDHLVDHPDSLIVAWIADDAVRRDGGPVS
jgi:hypothetical protein